MTQPPNPTPPGGTHVPQGSLYPRAYVPPPTAPVAVPLQLPATGGPVQTIEPQTPTTSLLARLSLIFGFFSVPIPCAMCTVSIPFFTPRTTTLFTLFWGGVITISTGIAGIKEINQSHGTYLPKEGMRSALGGICLGVSAILLACVLSLLMVGLGFDW